MGGEAQSALLGDLRFYVPAFLGHRGWIALDLLARVDALEIRQHLLHSDRHFAQKRMLAQLPFDV